MSSLFQARLSEKKTAATFRKKETVSMKFVVGPQAWCILETLSRQMIFAALKWQRFGLIQLFRVFI
jgi:glycine cleavage system aminomethyltransferase T